VDWNGNLRTVYARLIDRLESISKSLYKSHFPDSDSVQVPVHVPCLSPAVHTGKIDDGKQYASFPSFSAFSSEDARRQDGEFVSEEERIEWMKRLDVGGHRINGRWYHLGSAAQQSTLVRVVAVYREPTEALPFVFLYFPKGAFGTLLDAQSYFADFCGVLDNRQLSRRDRLVKVLESFLCMLSS